MRSLTALTLLALLSQSARADELAAATDVELPTLRLTGGVFDYTQSMVPMNPTGSDMVDGFVDGRSPNYGHLDDAMAEFSLDGGSTATPGHRTRAAEPHAAATRDGFRRAGLSTDYCVTEFRDATLRFARTRGGSSSDDGLDALVRYWARPGRALRGWQLSAQGARGTPAPRASVRRKMIAKKSLGDLIERRAVARQKVSFGEVKLRLERRNFPILQRQRQAGRHQRKGCRNPDWAASPAAGRHLDWAGRAAFKVDQGNRPRNSARG